MPIIIWNVEGAIVSMKIIEEGEVEVTYDNKHYTLQYMK
jgi:hypothetical protein